MRREQPLMADFTEGLRVRHVSLGGGCGLGTVYLVNRQGVHVEYDRPVRGKPRRGIYNEEWFRTANARLEIIAHGLRKHAGDNTLDRRLG
jgi:hypothetical protein